MGKTLSTPSDASLFARIETGLPFSVVTGIRKRTGWEESKIRTLARISNTSFARRRESGAFSAEESDRLARLDRFLQTTLAFFEGDRDAMNSWLESPAPSLGRQKPIGLLVNDAGIRAVEAVLGRLEHGVFA